jgi:hypothetical protein
MPHSGQIITVNFGNHKQTRFIRNSKLSQSHSFGGSLSTEPFAAISDLTVCKLASDAVHTD